MAIITWDDLNNFRNAVREMNAALGIFPMVLIADKRGDEIEPDETIQPEELPKIIGHTCNGLALWSYHDDANPV